MQTVLAPLAETDATLREIAVRVDRRTLALKKWIATSEDGLEFNFDLVVPLKHGDVIYQANAAQYVIRQAPEPVLEIALDIPPSVAAGIGWAVGNQHLELSAEATRLLTPDEPSTRQLLERLRMPFNSTMAVFRPGRFARGQQQSAQDLGSSHRH